MHRWVLHRLREKLGYEVCAGGVTIHRSSSGHVLRIKKHHSV